MRRAAVSLAIALICATAGLAAQDSTKVAKGDAVKVTAPSRDLHEWPGVFEQRTGDTITVRGSGADTARVVLPIGVITRFEVNHGNQKSHGHALTGLLVGFGAGAIVGAVDGSSCDKSSTTICFNSGEEALMLGAIGGLLGAGIGALIRSDPFTTVTLQPQVKVSALPGGRVGLGFSLHL